MNEMIPPSYTLKAMQKQADTERRLDEIYDLVEVYIRDDRIGEIDDILSRMVVRETPVDELLAWLTATLPIKSKLEQRDKVYDQACFVYGAKLFRGLN